MKKGCSILAKDNFPPIEGYCLLLFHSLFPAIQTSMNVRVLNVTSVTLTLCVPTLTDPMYAVA